MPSLDAIPLDQPLGGVVGSGTPADPRLIIEIWLAVPRAGGWGLLMCRRVPDRGGFWQGVSGRVETTDTTLRSAALRELEEELSLAATDVTTILDLKQSYDFTARNGVQVYRKRCFAVVLPKGTTPASVTLSEEHDDCRMMSFEQAIDMARFPEYVTELVTLETLLYAGI